MKLEELIEKMISIVEENAKNNTATIPDVEAWAIGWREELERYKLYDKIDRDPWIFVYGKYLNSKKDTNMSDFYDFLENNYEEPKRKEISS